MPDTVERFNCFCELQGKGAPRRRTRQRVAIATEQRAVVLAEEPENVGVRGCDGYSAPQESPRTTKATATSNDRTAKQV